MDYKTVMSHVQDLQITLLAIYAERMDLSENFQVAIIIEKLPSTWKGFKSYLQHKRKEMNLEDLIIKIQVEENNKIIIRNASFLWLRQILWTIVRVTRIRRPTRISWVQQEES